VIET